MSSYYIVLGVVTIPPVYILFGIMLADMTKGHIFSFIPRNIKILIWPIILVLSPYHIILDIIKEEYVN